MKSSPFKFLNAFERGDPYFFGRNTQIKELEEIVRMNRLTLIYGASGVGKTSLVQCGLDARFDRADWHPVFVQRRGNIKASIYRAFGVEVDNKSGDDFNYEEIGEVITRFQDLIRRPVYLIIDQLEEVYIYGSTKEQNDFSDLVVSIISQGLPCQLILICREKYIGRLADLETKTQLNYSHKYRVPPMTWGVVREEVLVKTFEKESIKVPYAKVVYERMGSNLLTSESEEEVRKIEDDAEIELPFLQIYLDRLWSEKIAHEPEGERDVTADEVKALGPIVPILKKYIKEEKKSISLALTLDEAFIDSVLEWLVTEEKTKKGQLFTPEGNGKYCFETPKDGWSQEDSSNVYAVLKKLEKSRLVRFEEDYVELSHDLLAKIISEKTPEEQRKALLIKDFEGRYNTFKQYESKNWRGLLLSDVEVGRFLELRNADYFDEDRQKFYDDSREKWENQDKKDALAAKEKKYGKIIRYLAFMLFVACVVLVISLNDVKTKRNELSKKTSELEEQKGIVEEKLESANRTLDLPYFVQSIEEKIEGLKLYDAKRDFLDRDFDLSDTTILSDQIVSLTKEMVFIFINIRDYESANKVVEKVDLPGTASRFKVNLVPEKGNEEEGVWKSYLDSLLVDDTKLGEVLNAKYLPTMIEVAGRTFYMGVDSSYLLLAKEHYSNWYNGLTLKEQGDHKTVEDQVEKNLKDKPSHLVEVNSYALSATEVTLHQYQLMVLRYKDTTAFRAYLDRAFVDRAVVRGDLPVVRVSWIEAAEYTNWLSDYYGEKPLYDRLSEADKNTPSNSVLLRDLPSSYRLMTIAEYENAVKDREPWRLFGTSNNADSSAVLGIYQAIYPEPMKSRIPNKDGIYDLVGNVWEWTHNVNSAPAVDGVINPGDPVPEKGKKTVDYWKRIAVGSSRAGYIGKQHMLTRFQSDIRSAKLFRTIRVARYSDNRESK